jgi:hypothetical protein
VAVSGLEKIVHLGMVDWRAPLPIVIACKNGVAPLIRPVRKIIATSRVPVFEQTALDCARSRHQRPVHPWRSRRLNNIMLSTVAAKWIRQFLHATLSETTTTPFLWLLCST